MVSAMENKAQNRFFESGWEGGEKLFKKKRFEGKRERREVFSGRIASASLIKNFSTSQGVSKDEKRKSGGGN